MQSFKQIFSFLVLSLLFSCARVKNSETVEASNRTWQSSDCPKRMESACARAQFYSERIGFAEKTQGALGARIYVVTHAGDAGPGSLRYGLESPEPLWIVFAHSMQIDLQTPVRVTSFKTVDGRGAVPEIRGHGLLLQQAQHVVLYNMRFKVAVGAAIEMTDRSQMVWLHHLSFLAGRGNALRMGNGSTDLSVSSSHFKDQSSPVVFGHGAQDSDLRVTLFANYLDGSTNVNFKVRAGRVHAFNNYFTGWRNSAVESEGGGSFYSEGNVFEAAAAKLGIRSLASAKRGEAGAVRSELDMFVNGAKADLKIAGQNFYPWEYYVYQVEKAGRELTLKIQQEGGVHP